MRDEVIENHNVEGVALVDTRSGLLLKAIHHNEDGNLGLVMCHDPSQAHIFTNPSYLNEFLSEFHEDVVLSRRRQWLRISMNRQTQVVGSIEHLYQMKDIHKE